LGYVEDENLPAIVGAAEAMIYISLFEGFGIPILEAMACGVPVITSNKSSMPEVAGDAAILVDPLNIDEIVNAMGRALSENEKAKLTAKMPANLARYDWKRSSQTLHQVAKKLLE
jgi:glycosyltransferase involved in cell wall biosynthesis